MLASVVVMDGNWFFGMCFLAGCAGVLLGGLLGNWVGYQAAWRDISSTRYGDPIGKSPGTVRYIIECKNDLGHTYLSRKEEPDSLKVRWYFNPVYATPYYDFESAKRFVLVLNSGAPDGVAYRIVEPEDAIDRYHDKCELYGVDPNEEPKGPVVETKKEIVEEEDE